MSYGSNPSRYLENDVLSRSPEWLVPLLYEHLIKNLTRASIHIEAGNLEGKSFSLDLANQIVMELLSTLDHERGGEIAKNLSSLYTYLVGEIIAIGRTLDTEHLRRLIGLVSELHEAWVKAAEQVAPRGRTGLPALSAAVA